MFVLLLLMPATAGDTMIKYRLPPARPGLPCLTGTCTPPPRRQNYRVPDDPDPLARTSKERAFAADGSKCSVVGDKFCTSRGRTIFRTDFTE